MDKNTPTTIPHSLRHLVLILFSLIAAGSAQGQTSQRSSKSDTSAAQGWSFETITEAARLYDSPNAPVLQRFALTGRLQADAEYFDAHEGEVDRLTWRRVRAGFKAKLFQDFTAHVEANFDFNDRDPLYDGLTDTYLKWSPSNAFSLAIGKQSAAFTLDGSTSSKKLYRMERSLLSNNLWFPQEYHSGIVAEGTSGKWIYSTGVFSSSSDDEFGPFDAGYFGLLSAGYDFAETAGLDRALVRLDYVYNDPDPGNSGTRSLEHVVSLNGQFEKGPWTVWADLAAGSGYLGQSDLVGFAIMPLYSITEKLQLVASYNIVSSDDDNGVRLDRYENRIVSGRSDTVQEFYAGFNYFFHGHNVKWQSGVEYTRADDNANDGGEYDGWGISTGIRICW